VPATQPVQKVSTIVYAGDSVVLSVSIIRPIGFAGLHCSAANPIGLLPIGCKNFNGCQHYQHRKNDSILYNYFQV
jgi:hypothetical protein